MNTSRTKRLKLAAVYIAGMFSGLAIILLLSRIFPNSSDYIMHNIEISPNRQYYAVVYTRMGGGAAGYCDSYLSVVPSKKFPEFRKAKYTVVHADCSGNQTAQWLDNNHLEAMNLKDVYQSEGQNEDGIIQISLTNTTFQ